ncbi:hypothetical protein [Desulfofalx alkaliphila]|uniref:hypothetical protein n=1 Tax=Desulfofalx alkaliphila TaxID=105483 RepID=UPI0004E27E69|nr:hypothetical protein [Desulfofalx alkaliphila]
MDYQPSVKTTTVHHKNPAALLGTLYLICFCLMLPFYLTYSGSQILTESVMLLLSLVAIVGVHILLNWAYCLAKIIPITMSIILFATGSIVWVMTPLFMAPLEMILGVTFGTIDIFTRGVGSSFMVGVSGMIGGVTETVSRIGQLLMIIAGWFWWLAEKTSKLDQKALGFYLICLAAFGVISGLASLYGLLIFLYFWLIVLYQLEGRDDVPRLRLIFQLVATVIIALKVPTSIIYTEMTVTNQISSWLSAYQSLLMIIMLLVVWKPNMLVDVMPDKIKELGSNILNNGKAFIKI